MSPTRRERKNPQLEAKLGEYRQWARTYGGYPHGTALALDGTAESICFRWFRLNRIQRGDIDFPVLQPGKLELMSLLYGETGMPEVNRKWIG